MAKKTASVEAKPEASAEGVNKSEFIRGELSKNPKAMFKHVSEAWNASGNKELLTASLFYFVKSKFGKSIQRRGRPRSDQGLASSGAGTENETSDIYLQIESELDKLISRAPDSKTAEALRAARRRVSAKLV